MKRPEMKRPEKKRPEHSSDDTDPVVASTHTSTVCSPPDARPSSPLSRRSFLAAMGAVGAGVAGVGFTSLAGPTITRAAQATGSRSLVCVFLAGGADSFNMVVPLDHDVAGQTHDAYSATRGSFAVPAGQLIGIGEGSFGLHPGLAGLADLSASGRLATVMNVGPLERPITAADYTAQRSLPQSLFAHDAQQKLWQTGRSRLASDAGWGGSIETALSADADLAPAFSINGSNTWQAGPTARYTRLSPTVRVARMLGHDESLRAWIPTSEGVASVLADSLAAAQASSSRIDQTIASTISDSIDATEQLQEATAASDANDVGMDDAAGTKLGSQLRMVARLIKNREMLGMPRQVFFVRMGGWDTHRVQQQIFPRLIGELDGALASFHVALDDLGVSESVTTFTASDFGRTLTANGDGTDHGWGGHAFVMGGAVRGGRYGEVPSYATDRNPDDVGSRSGDFAGRLVPTTSVSQYGATLAGWMGLTATQIDDAFPDLANFAERDLGFL